MIQGPVEVDIYQNINSFLIRNLSPADADYNLLDVARRLEMYGVILYPAKDKVRVELFLAAAHMGVLVFQDGSKINTFLIFMLAG
ncbi:PREDICTED: FERM domain-containing protein 7-like [Acropora digitifera]|uniref:FERM domain-containing protein 7-like n=1 Tax=Acropora digitifera TaxID=70779 RepID=UPI00077A1188|nr:PREDICTED: FERM domain-containing protein 7-like [Acropora digitifera]